MELLGTVARLQLQRATLKVSEGRRRFYDPAPILSVPLAILDEGGVSVLTPHRAAVLDVHHRHHPASKYSSDNAVSVGFTSHYDSMRTHFGLHLEDGIAGENLLIQTGRVLSLTDLTRGLILLSAEGDWTELCSTRVAEPCVEFTRFALRFPDNASSDRTVTDALTFLRAGMRGFYFRYDGEPVTLRLGDPVYLP